jgi:glycine betaine/proline transport system substrate-binding protein
MFATDVANTCTAITLFTLERAIVKIKKTLPHRFPLACWPVVLSQAASWCESGKPVRFAGLNWESGILLTDVLQVLLKEGYGCEIDTLPGTHHHGERLEQQRHSSVG